MIIDQENTASILRSVPQSSLRAYTKLFSIVVLYPQDCDVEQLEKQLIDWMIRSAVVGPEVFSDHSTPGGMPGSQLAAVSNPLVAEVDQPTSYNANGNPPAYAIGDKTQV